MFYGSEDDPLNSGEKILYQKSAVAELSVSIVTRITLPDFASRNSAEDSRSTVRWMWPDAAAGIVRSLDRDRFHLQFPRTGAHNRNHAHIDQCLGEMSVSRSSRPELVRLRAALQGLGGTVR